jgi:hypothetical protein
MKGRYGSEEADQKDRSEKWVEGPGEEESSKSGIVEDEVMKGRYGSEEADQKDRSEKWVGVPGEEESSKSGIVED